MPGPPGFLQKTIARQLGGPSGPFGSLIARILNKGNAPTMRAAVDALDLVRGETVADIGFGGGLGLDLLLEAVGASGHVIGVDPATDMVSRAQKKHRDALGRGRLELHEGRLETLPLPDEALGAWLTLNTIYFLDDLDAAAAELARVLVAGGRGVVGVADPEWMASDSIARHGFKVRRVEDVVGVLTAAGLEVERRELHDEHQPAYNLLVCRRS